MEALALLLYELGRTKRIERSGWMLARIAGRIESVADHSFRATVISYFLAQRENANTLKAVLMTLFHDVSETRLGDLDPIAKNLMSGLEEAEELATAAQFTDKIPNGSELREILKEFKMQESLEARIAHDADVIECELQAHEYEAQTFVQFFRADEKVSCQSSMELLDAIRATPRDRWWQSQPAISGLLAGKTSHANNPSR